MHADKEACLRLLRHCDFGFVRQVLTFTRRHNESITSLTNSLDTRRKENLLLLEKYGPVALSDSEFLHARSRELRTYYDFLARKAGTGMGQEFWGSHRHVLHAAGFPFSRSKMLHAMVRRWTNPRSALKEYIRDTSDRDHKAGKKVSRFLSASRANRQGNDK